MPLLPTEFIVNTYERFSSAWWKQIIVGENIDYIQIIKKHKKDDETL
jgi:hypothetical protein